MRMANSDTFSPDFPFSLAVIGSGTMGRGIAQVAARAAIPVRLYDAAPGKAAEAIAAITQEIQQRHAAGKLTGEAIETIPANLKAVNHLADIAGVNLVIEAIVENLEAKRALFAEVEDIVSDDCILATNTSSLLVTSIARTCRKPERIGGAHFFNPVPAMKIAEVIAGARTSAITIDALSAFVRRVGHAPVEAADTPGFLINHAGRGLYTEGARIISEGIAAPQDVDEIMRHAAGFRMGPFELFDLTGLDVSFPVLLQIHAEFYQEPRFRPVPLLRRQVEAGLFGRKVGEGFYRYRDGQLVTALPILLSEWQVKPVWIDPTDRERFPWVVSRLEAHAIAIDAGDVAPEDAIILVLPIGADATTTATRSGFDPARVMALDPLIADVSRLTLMPTVATKLAFRDSLVGMVCNGGGTATLIHDSPGFVAQRVLAMIVNVACDIAQQRIASPQDIDFAVRAGLGYPSGPLCLGDTLGPKTVLTIIEELQSFYGDPRYRPSPWLKRRALVGGSLLHPDA